MTTAPDTGRTAEEMLFYSEAGLVRLKANLAAVEPFEVSALIGDIRKLSASIAHLRAENANLRDRVREAEGAAEAMRERCAREAERVVKVPARMIGGMRVERLPMAPRTPREIAAAIRDLQLNPNQEAGDA